MTADTRPWLARVWAPAGLPEQGTPRLYYRANILTALVGLVWTVLMPGVVIWAFAYRTPLAGQILLAVTLLGVANMSVLQAFRLAYLFEHGRWKGWQKQILHRADHPRQFWFFAAGLAATLAVSVAAMVFLALNLFACADCPEPVRCTSPPPTP